MWCYKKTLSRENGQTQKTQNRGIAEKPNLREAVQLSLESPMRDFAATLRSPAKKSKTGDCVVMDSFPV